MFQSPVEACSSSPSQLAGGWRQIDYSSVSSPVQPAIRTLCCGDTICYPKQPGLHRHSTLYIRGTYQTSCAHYKLITCATATCFMAYQIKFALQCSEGLYSIFFWTLFRNPVWLCLSVSPGGVTNSLTLTKIPLKGSDGLSKIVFGGKKWPNRYTILLIFYFFGFRQHNICIDVLYVTSLHHVSPVSRCQVLFTYI
jgi:hypothetical protein